MRRFSRIAGAALLLAGGGANADPLPPEEAGRFAAPGITYRGGASLHFLGIEFGGLSALAVLDGGHRALALSDAGHWFELALNYDTAGNLADAKLLRHGPVVDAAGKPPASKRAADTEALAALLDGGFAVAYEQQHHIMRFPPSDPPLSRPPVAFATPEGLSRAPANGGIEALAALADGRFIALAEALPAPAAFVGDRTGSWGRGWIGDGQSWASFAYALEAGFAPSDATVLPDGDILVLERARLSLVGFAIRLVRLAPGELGPGRAVTGREVARLSLPFVGDNFEGLAARRAADGRTLLYLVSDNNFSPLLRTALVMFELN
ncbi:MAG: esterase-like activity of phytase family protein [Alphaproteobacteria bacterium]|nr:esterase-like activity of phytase family protein [Alphaproteobacteria bacterium]